jgi:hypothetical protein
VTADRFRRTIVQIATGYGRAIRRFAWTILLLAGAVAVSAAIVFPLWYFSTHNRTGYTITVLCVFAVAVLFFVFRRTRTFWDLPPRERRRRVRRTVGRILIVLAYILGLYLTLGFYMVGLVAVAVPLSAVYLFALGYTLYVRKPRHS